MLIEYREHGNGDYRVWTQEDAAYGAFQVISREDLIALERISKLMHWTCRPADNEEPVTSGD